MIRRLLERWRTPAPPRMPPQPEAEKDWAVADVAECIAYGGTWIDVRSGQPSEGPRLKQLSRVADLFADDVTVWLVLREFPGQGYPAGHFRKLRPGTIEIERAVDRAIREPELVQ